MFVDVFFSKFSELQKPPRHPLWKTVNLAATIPGWTRFAAAEEWLVNWRAGQAKNEAELFKEFISEQPERKLTEPREQLFRDFVIWLNKRNKVGVR